MYIDGVIHQLKISIDSVLKMIELLSDADLQFRPIKHKKSVGELVQHVSECIGADLLISNGASKDEMEDYYASVKCASISEIKALLTKGFNQVMSAYKKLSEEDLNRKVKAYWGIEYTRYEWLLEILVHFTHHRAQLHTLLTLKYNDINIALFE